MQSIIFVEICSSSLVSLKYNLIIKLHFDRKNSFKIHELCIKVTKDISRGRLKIDNFEDFIT